MSQVPHILLSDDKIIHLKSIYIGVPLNNPKRMGFRVLNILII